MTITPESNLELSKCAECGRFQYPPRVLCCYCLSDHLVWGVADDKGIVLTDTLVHYSLEEELVKTVPNHIGIVKLDAGPTVFANLERDVQKGDRVMISLQAGFQDLDTFVARSL